MEVWQFIRTDRHPLGTSDLVIAKGMVVNDSLGLYTRFKQGLYGAKNLAQALCYAPGPVLCRIELEGDTFRGERFVVTPGMIAAEKMYYKQVVDITDFLYRYKLHR